jgi:hypothetical protein
VFPLQREPATALSYTFTAQASRHVVAGCPVRQHVEGRVADQSPIRSTAGEGGIAVLDLPRKVEGKMRIELSR